MEKIKYLYIVVKELELELMTNKSLESTEALIAAKLALLSAYEEQYGKVS